MPALVPRTDFVKHAVRNEPIENFAERCNRGQRLGAVSAGINDLHVRRSTAAFVVFAGTGTVKELQEENLRMFSIADMAVAGAVALLLFGPDQLPKVARRAGQLVRDVQNTSHSFIREMERAADTHDLTDAQPVDPAPAITLPSAPAYHAAPEPAAHDVVAREGALDPQPRIPDRPAEPASPTPGESISGR